MPGDPGAGTRESLLLVPALDAGLLEQLAVLLLGHALAALLDHRPHEATLLQLRMTGAPTRSPGEGGWTHTQRMRVPPKWRAGVTDRGRAPKPGWPGPREATTCGRAGRTAD